MCLRGQPQPHHKGRGPSVNKVLGTPYIATKFGKVTHVGHERVSDAVATFPSQESGGGAKRPHHQIFGTSCIRVHSMRNDCQILHDGQTKCEEICT